MKTDNQFRLSRTVWQLPVFAIVYLIAWGCATQAGDMEQAVTNDPPVTVPGTPVDAVVLAPSELKESIDINATLVPNQQVDIVSEMTRRIVAVHAREGSEVSQGTLLFRLDDADLQAQLAKLRQQEQLAVINEQRLKDLLAHDAISQQDYDEASTNLKVLQAQIQELSVAIDKTQITAPFHGKIGMINVHKGSVVSPSTVLADIEDTGTLKVEFSVPEKYAALVAVGDEITFTIPASNKNYKARISATNPGLNESTRSLLVRALTNNAQGELFPGQSARVSLAFKSTPNSLSVTANALVPSSKGYTVFVARDGVAQAVPVEIGQRNSSTVQIISGLQKGDTVITSNLLRLGPGVPVSLASVK